MMTSILLTVDGSEQSVATVGFAALMAKSLNLPIDVLCVIDTSTLIAESGLAADEAGTQAQRIADSVTEDLSRRGVTVHRHVIEGDPADTIAETARLFGSSLLVIGHRHMSIFGRIFEPSICISVLEQVHIPTLVVPTMTGDSTPDLLRHVSRAP